jgi:hypothetical protein
VSGADAGDGGSYQKITSVHITLTFLCGHGITFLASSGQFHGVLCVQIRKIAPNILFASMVEPQGDT